MDLLWELVSAIWTAVTAAGSLAFLLIAGLALFGLLFGLPYAVGRRRRERRLESAARLVPPDVLERLAPFAGVSNPVAVLAQAPELRGLLSGYGVPVEELLERLLPGAPEEPPEEPED